MILIGKFQFYRIHLPRQYLEESRKSS